MKRVVSAICLAAVLAAPAVADIRPDGCAPVFPLMDKVAEVVPQDVQVAQAGPAPAARKGFFGLPLLLPLLLAGGGAVILGTGGHNSVSPD